jgi:hypothetical protein
MSADGIEDAIAQLRAALERDPNGLQNDDITKGILEKLNVEVAKLYDEAGDEDEEDEIDEQEEDQMASSKRSEVPHLMSRRTARMRSHASTGSVQMPKGPKPVDLWRAAHEINRAVKDKVALTKDEWSNLVGRLTDSSKSKQLHLLRSQHKQIADELAGMTFTPHISEKSRELAAHNKTLPDRVAALMRKKKAKLDKIRQEKAQRELSEATFRPVINKRSSTAPPTDRGPMSDTQRRRVGHLMQYEMDKRIRAAQRREIIREMEEKSLTFSPAINRNSIRIVERLQREREGDATQIPAYSLQDAGVHSGAVSPSRAGKRDIPLGRSFLPGHEEETFHPKINPKSQALYKNSTEDKSVYDRLYGTSSSQKKSELGEPTSQVAPTPAKSSVTSFPVDEAGEPAPGHPQYFNVVAYNKEKMGFVLKLLRVQ